MGLKSLARCRIHQFHRRNLYLTMNGDRFASFGRNNSATVPLHVHRVFCLAKAAVMGLHAARGARVSLRASVDENSVGGVQALLQRLLSSDLWGKKTGNMHLSSPATVREAASISSRFLASSFSSFYSPFRIFAIDRVSLSALRVPLSATEQP